MTFAITNSALGYRVSIGFPPLRLRFDWPRIENPSDSLNYEVANILGGGSAAAAADAFSAR